MDVVEINVNIIESKFENSGSSKSNDNDGYDIIYSKAYLSVFTLKNCHFNFNKGNNIINIVNDKPPDYFRDTVTNVYSDYFTDIVTDVHVNLINSVFRHNKGVSVKLKSIQGNTTLNITGEVLFESNVAENGAGISLIGYTSTVMFGENSNTTFVNNSADSKGAAMYLEDHSSAIFDSNSIVKFANNKATNGIIYSNANSRVIFKGICQVTFSGNSATQYSSAIYSTNSSLLIFTENATVMFSNNNCMSSDDVYIRQGGTIFSEYYSLISFQENCNAQLMITRLILVQQYIQLAIQALSLKTGQQYHSMITKLITVELWYLYHFLISHLLFKLRLPSIQMQYYTQYITVMSHLLVPYVLSKTAISHFQITHQ